jgi:flagellar biogenesis protein FliO
MFSIGNWLTTISVAAATEGIETLKPMAAAPDFAFWPSLINILTVLCAMVGVMLLCLSLWKRFAPRSQRHPALIKVLATHYLTPKQALILVSVGEETFLLASSPNNLNVTPMARGIAGEAVASTPAAQLASIG